MYLLCANERQRKTGVARGRVGGGDRQWFGAVGGGGWLGGGRRRGSPRPACQAPMSANERLASARGRAEGGGYRRWFGMVVGGGRLGAGGDVKAHGLLVKHQ